MTELERELSRELRLQQRAFERKLKEITQDYQASLKQISEAYSEQMSEAKRIIERQSQLLSRYESVSGSVQVKLDTEQVRSLEVQLSTLAKRLNDLERADDDFTRQLNALLQRLN